MSVFSFNAGANLPRAIDQIRDVDWDRLVELTLTSCMALLAVGNVTIKAIEAVGTRPPRMV